MRLSSFRSDVEVFLTGFDRWSLPLDNEVAWDPTHLRDYEMAGDRSHDKLRAMRMYMRYDHIMALLGQSWGPRWPKQDERWAHDGPRDGSHMELKRGRGVKHLILTLLTRFRTHFDVIFRHLKSHLDALDTI